MKKKIQRSALSDSMSWRSGQRAPSVCAFVPALAALGTIGSNKRCVPLATGRQEDRPSNWLPTAQTNRGSAVYRCAPLLLILFGWLTAITAQAQIGTPVDLGSNQSQTTTAGAPPPLSVTTTASVPAGASIIVIAVSTRATSLDGQVTSAVCSDSAGNAYNTDVSQNAGLNSLTTICSTHGLAAQLPLGSTITITWSGGNGTQLGRVHAFSVTGLATTPLDGTASGAGTSSSPSTGTVTTTQADELLFGAIMSEGDSASAAGFTPGSGYTTLGGVGGTPPSLFGEYRIVSATGNYVANGTLGTINPFWHALLATYKAACSITCANITKSNDLNQCGAVVTYDAPTTTGPCGTVVCSPVSGSFFPVGTTAVTCMSNNGEGPEMCTFTVTVQDTQPPSITCPANVTAVAAQTCPISSSATVTFPAPTASDNCPGVTVACTPPSGSTLPIGTTTVTCTATDASGNPATCSFTVTVFSGCLQDDSNPANVVLFNAATGKYRFCCNGTVFTGVGTVLVKGCIVTIQHYPADRRVLIKFDGAVRAGTASLQSPPGSIRCTITDRNTTNNTMCTCGAPAT